MAIERNFSMAKERRKLTQAQWGKKLNLYYPNPGNQNVAVAPGLTIAKYWKGFSGSFAPGRRGRICPNDIPAFLPAGGV